ncbi:stamen-specific protein FIL1 [Juglans microcarpa x Juglans regia]|uniref:stamen-specific protein FIL1 n=1 Tax=Juglans microcarpa x Juglans regia TaxID=2249226 RepID=UPI001B7DD326|nr:stamen-specific protein FIL1 [Juglans microcarpa x Juglans regia]
MAAIKSLVSQVAVLMLVVLAVQTQTAQAQMSCPAELSNLNVCAPYVVPGAANVVPSSECCSALQSVQHDCLCSTLRIASQLPAQCNVPAVSCGVN